MKNTGLKIFSLALALLLAYVVNSRQNAVTASFSVSLELKNLPDSKLLLSPIQPEVQVTVRGPSFLVRPLKSSPPSIVFRLPNTLGDSFTLGLKAEDVPVPAAVEVLRIEPSEVEFRFDTLLSKRVKIELSKVGQLRSGLTLESVQIEPGEVEIRGIRRELDSIKIVQTQPLDLRTIERDGAFVLGLKLPGNITSPEVQQVKLDLRISRAEEERQLTDCPVELRMIGEARALRIVPSQVDIVLGGTSSALQGAGCSSFVRVEPREIGKLVRVSVDLPEGVKLKKIEPQQVKIEAIETVPLKRR